MPDIQFTFALSAFAAGILTFLAPCTLPLIPAYLGFVSGVPSTKTELNKVEKVKILRNGSLFTFGFTIIFVLFGMLASILGQELAFARPILATLGGTLVVLFGLHTLGIFPVLLFNSSRHISSGVRTRPGTSTAALLLGISFALGWTPCVGPMLGSILFLSSTADTAINGTLLLLIFSSGLALPFIGMAIFFTKSRNLMMIVSRYNRSISIISGLLLVFLGLFLATDSFPVLIRFFFYLFDFMNYREILKYL